MKKSDVLDLIKYHYESKETEFRNQSIAIARNFDKHGDTQLAQYIMGMLSQSDRLVPQIENTSEYLTPAKLDIGPLPLPLPIMNDLKGIINAVNHHIGINKFLFVGAPGTGKTESVKQVTRLIGKELLVVDFSHLVDSKLGQTVKNLAALFNEINHLPFKQNYIILFDEIDSIVLDRVNQNDLREMGRVTSAFLKELDRLSPEIILIATTNLFENLDKAVNVARDLKLFKKIIYSSGTIPNPGDLRNLIRTSLAFSDPTDPHDYQKRLLRSLHNGRNLSISKLSKLGFTVREIEILTGISKSSVSRELSED